MSRLPRQASLALRATVGVPLIAVLLILAVGFLAACGPTNGVRESGNRLGDPVAHAEADAYAATFDAHADALARIEATLEDLAWFVAEARRLPDGHLVEQGEALAGADVEAPTTPTTTVAPVPP